MEKIFTLENGDYLERFFATEIRQKLPYYETIWQIYIGHDGNGKMITVPELSEQEQEIRERFSQYMYSSMESLLCMISISKNHSKVDLKNPDEYILFINTFLAFQAHAGRIHDLAVKQLKLYIKGNECQLCIEKLNNLYQQRNNVLHESKLPMRIIDDFVEIVKPEGSNINTSEWSKNSKWSDFDETDYITLVDYYKNNIDEISLAYNGILSAIYGKIQGIVKRQNIDLKSIKQTSFEFSGEKEINPPPSGSAICSTIC